MIQGRLCPIFDGTSRPARAGASGNEAATVGVPAAAAAAAKTGRPHRPQNTAPGATGAPQLPQKLTTLPHSTAPPTGARLGSGPSRDPAVGTEGHARDDPVTVRAHHLRADRHLDRLRQQ